MNVLKHVREYVNDDFHTARWYVNNEMDAAALRVLGFFYAIIKAIVTFVVYLASPLWIGPYLLVSCIKDWRNKKRDVHSEVRDE